MAVIVPIISKFVDKGVKQAQSAFGGLSKSIKTTVGALGIGLGLGALTSQLQAAGKAAAQDAKSQGLLANALRNSIGATDAQVASTEAFIGKLQNSTSILDDNLRPAMATAIRATGDLTKAQQILSIATDVSAGTGKDLELVTKSIARALDGNTTGLQKLVPGFKKGSDVVAELTKKFEGAAAAAANLDPYARLNVVMNDLQEQIGIALLPYLNELADYFTSAEGQKALSEFADNVGEMTTSIFELAGTIVDTGILDLLTEFLSVAAKVAKLDFGGINDQLNTNFMNSWVDKYINNNKAFLNDMEVISKERPELAKKIQNAIDQFLKGVTNTQGQFGSIRGIEDSFAKSTKKGTGTDDKKRQDDSKKEGAATAAKKLAEAAKKVAEDLAESLKKETEALADFSKELLGLADGVKPLIDLGREIGQFEQSTVDSFDAIAKSIQDGIGNSTIIARAGKNILDYVATERKALTAIAQKRDELASKRSLAEALIGDVKAAVAGFAQITDLVKNETGNLVSNFTNVVSKTKAFASQLKQLRELGLDKNLYKQILDAGIEAGGATAAEIIAGGAGTVGELNNLFTELQTVGAAIAEDTALVMYNNGVEVAGGLVAGLMSQEQALVNAATALADAFSRTFNSMVADLKVPSQEMDTLSLNIADIAAGNTGIAGANSAVSRGLANRYLNATNGQGATTITINVKAGLGTDGKAVGQAIQAELNKYNRSNVALV